MAVGKPSRLYEHCISSVVDYAERIGADHFVLRKPALGVRPDPLKTGRSQEAISKYECEEFPKGYLPIFEKEVGFAFLEKYDKVGVIDADVYVRQNVSQNIFDEFDTPFAAMRECDLPMLPWYRRKLIGYSRMQYGQGGCQWPREQFVDEGIAKFRNMGVMLFDDYVCDYDINLPDNILGFIEQSKFKKFVDGVGAFKWSTDQTMLNDWLYQTKMPTHDLDWKWNCLYGTTNENNLREAKFVHFFLKDKLPNRGENVKELMKSIGEPC